MKIITETIEDIEYITEENENGKKNLFIEGIFMQAEKQNRNGRVYPISVLRKESQRYIKDNIDKKRAYGELNHPSGPTINLDKVSHMIVSLKEDGNNFIGKAKILDTPNGQIVKELINQGASLGVSSRGVGNLKPRKNGINEVMNDFRLITPADIVADPSANEAFVNGIMEMQEFWMNPQTGNIEKIEAIRKDIVSMKAKEVEEKASKLFEDYIKSL